MIFIIYVDKIDNDNVVQIMQVQLVGNGLSCFNIGIKNGVVEIMVFDKCVGIDIYCCYCFGLVDDQIIVRFEFNFMFQCVLDFIFYVIKIEDWLMVIVMFQFIGYFWDVFCGKFQQ